SEDRDPWSSLPRGVRGGGQTLPSVPICPVWVDGMRARTPRNGPDSYLSTGLDHRGGVLRHGGNGAFRSIVARRGGGRSGVGEGGVPGASRRRCRRPPPSPPPKVGEGGTLTVLGGGTATAGTAVGWGDRGSEGNAPPRRRRPRWRNGGRRRGPG